MLTFACSLIRFCKETRDPLLPSVWGPLAKGEDPYAPPQQAGCCSSTSKGQSCSRDGSLIRTCSFSQLCKEWTSSVSVGRGRRLGIYTMSQHTTGRPDMESRGNGISTRGLYFCRWESCRLRCKNSQRIAGKLATLACCRRMRRLFVGSAWR